MKWIETGFNRFEHLIPCPSCLQPVKVQSMVSLTELRPDGFRCRNERCIAFSEWICIFDYYHEFKFILNRVKDGYVYPKKVIKFAKEMVSMFD